LDSSNCSRVQTLQHRQLWTVEWLNGNIIDGRLVPCPMPHTEQLWAVEWLINGNKIHGWLAPCPSCFWIAWRSHLNLLVIHPPLKHVESPVHGRGELTPRSATWENPKVFYFPRMIKFANFEFMFAIRSPKLARGGVHMSFSSTQ